MRQQASALHEHTQRRRKQHDPARIRVFGDQNRPLAEIHAVRVGDNPHAPAHDSGAASQTAAVVTPFDSNGVRTAEIMTSVDRSSCLETVVRRRLPVHISETRAFEPPRGHGDPCTSLSPRRRRAPRRPRGRTHRVGRRARRGRAGGVQARERFASRARTGASVQDAGSRDRALCAERAGAPS